MPNCEAQVCKLLIYLCISFIRLISGVLQFSNLNTYLYINVHTFVNLLIKIFSLLIRGHVSDFALGSIRTGMSRTCSYVKVVNFTTNSCTHLIDMCTYLYINA